MGEPLYEQVVGPVADGRLGRPCRIYAPVGTHETLLAYLVRRLLENGANTSFVNRIADASVPIDELVEDPVTTVERSPTPKPARRARRPPHPAIPLPRDLYGAARRNSRGLDLVERRRAGALAEALRASRAGRGDWRERAPLAWRGDDGADGDARTAGAQSRRPRRRRRPRPRGDARRRRARRRERARRRAGVGGDARRRRARRCSSAPPTRSRPTCRACSACSRARRARPIRTASPKCARRSTSCAIYAAQARRDLGGGDVAPLGPVVCISPWNFPLAIFTGQVAAALAAGNPVLAKPAEQTPLIAAEMVRRLHRAGVPRAALQLLPGRGETVGAALVADARVAGRACSPARPTSRACCRRACSTRLSDAGRAVTLIAETGGQNAMMVDSSALAEQVVADVVASAFDSAGQRCSALRVLCLQDDGADRIVAMLKGAMAESRDRRDRATSPSTSAR